MKTSVRPARVILVPALAAGLALAFAAATSHADVSTTLHASVGPDFQISLTFDDNSPVRTLPAGLYTVTVNDQATNHNFHILGPGVDSATVIENIEQPTWTVNLADASTYQFRCDRHPTQLNGSFTVGQLAEVLPIIATPSPATTVVSSPVPVPVTSPAPATSSSSAPIAPSFVTLTATLTARGAIVLSKAGRRVSTLPSGTYSLVLADNSEAQGLTVAQTSGGTARHTLTSARFVGRRTSLVTLAPGGWKVYSPGRSTAAMFSVVG